MFHMKHFFAQFQIFLFHMKQILFLIDNKFYILFIFMSFLFHMKHFLYFFSKIGLFTLLQSKTCFPLPFPFEVSHETL